MKISTDLIKKLKDKTGAPVLRIKNVLEEVKGNEKKALEILQKEGFEKVANREGRETGQGKVFSYNHHSGKISALVELLCETDFVAKNELFEELGRNIAMQVAAMNPKDVKELMEQDFIRPSALQASLIKDPSQKITDLVKTVIAKTGENIRIGKFVRIEIGK